MFLVIASGSSRQSRTDLNPVFFQVKDLVGKDWKELAIALDFTQPEVEQIEHDQQGFPRQCYHMLIKWSRKLGAQATLTRLIQALDRTGRRDIAEVLEGLLTFVEAR